MFLLEVHGHLASIPAACFEPLSLQVRSVALSLQRLMPLVPSDPLDGERAGTKPESLPAQRRTETHE